MSGKKPESPIPSDSGTAQPESVTRLSTEFHFAGPLPPPQILARYNEVIPNGAERILAMAEQQSRHREALEAQVVQANIAAQTRGSVFAFILALVTIVGGMFLIYSGRGVSGLVTIVSSLVALVSVFFYSRSRQGQERTRKAAVVSGDRKPQ